jgi:hypothetical protein
MESNVIELRKFQEIDPVLRRGDFVRLKKMTEFFDENPESADQLWDQIDPEDLEGAVGIVSSIELTLPLDHPAAPGQSMYVTVAVAFDEENWVEVHDVSIFHMSRIIGPDFM